jgi:response regulator RpfG family c-di-GMP phosphodiesterase
LRLLLVDDDAGFRALLRTTFELADVEVEEAQSAAEAAIAICTGRPDVLVLDVRMPGMDGLAFCTKLKSNPATSDIGIVLVTGALEGTADAARAAGADAFVRKPFSPIELIAVVERLVGGMRRLPFRPSPTGPPEGQLILYARDLRELLELERGQRRLLERAYKDTVEALATALESKDLDTGAHSERVQQYALELARTVDPALAKDPSVEYGFLLHDFGKIGIPDHILRKRAPLTDSERRLMEQHTVLGEQMLGRVGFLRGEGLRIVRSHHERWDGRGYPDQLAGADIPLGARIFSLADALDAMTSERPYRQAVDWPAAEAELLAQANRQFDPDVVEAFREASPALRQVQHDLAA